MSQEMYFLFENFLKRHELFNEKVYNYIKDNSVLVKYKNIEDFSSIGCSIVLDRKGRLSQVIPIVPLPKNKKMVAINIFIYVQAMILIPNIGKVFDENSYNNILPFVFQRLFILENSNKYLLSFEEKMTANLCRENQKKYDNIMIHRNTLIEGFKKDKESLNNEARKIRRKAKNYIYRNNNN